MRPTSGSVRDHCVPAADSRRRRRTDDLALAGRPALYVGAGIVLADALRSQGKAKEADVVLKTATQIATSSRTLNWFGGEAGILGAGGQLGPVDTTSQTAIPLGTTSDSPAVALPKKEGALVRLVADRWG